MAGHALGAQNQLVGEKITFDVRSAVSRNREYAFSYCTGPERAKARVTVESRTGTEEGTRVIPTDGEHVGIPIPLRSQESLSLNG